jgi:hypothetical protein
VRILSRVFFSIAAALGLISLGVEWRTRQIQSRRMFPQSPSPVGIMTGLGACAMAILGKVMEEVEVGGGPIVQRTQSFRPRRAKSLRSDYDLSDQQFETATNRRALAGVR